MSGLLSMLSFKLMTIKMGEFKFFTLKLCFRADWVLWVITLCIFLMYTPYPGPPTPCSLAGNVCIVKQEHRRVIGEEKVFKVVNLILF